MTKAIPQSTTEGASPSSWWRMLIYAVSDGTPACSMQVAVIVGTILNVINQGDALFGGSPIVWWKVALTYCVPYCVCTYGAVTSRLRHEPGSSERK